MKKSRVGRPKGENTENANRRRKQLVDATVKSIVTHGLSATTLASVAKASGLSQGTAIFYFKSKESLLNEAFRSRLEEYKKNWQDAVSSQGPDPVDRLTGLVFALLDFRLLTPENLVLWNSFWPEAFTNASFTALSKQHDVERQGTLLSLCTEAKKHFSNTVWTPQTVAHVLETMTEGAWSRMYYSPNYISPKQARIAAGTLLSAIFPSRSAHIMRLATEAVNDDEG